jgi:outer membrane lipoprotein-sorting protein
VLSLRIKVGAFVVFFLGCELAAHCQQSPGGVRGSAQTALLSAEQVAKNLEERDQQRAAALQEFTSQRVYHMHYHGLAGDYDAQMVVELTYRAPNAKQFRVVSQSGSTFLINHIFKKLMESEQEFISDEKRQQNTLNTENYNFALAGYELTANGPQYILSLSPKKKNKFLYRGKIWVDAKDFAVVRIEAEPCENPSMWIKRTRIEQKYMKVNDFWLPASDHTQSEIRLGGEATLSIEYKDYRILRASPLPGAERARAGAN